MVNSVVVQLRSRTERFSIMRSIARTISPCNYETPTITLAWQVFQFNREQKNKYTNSALNSHRHISKKFKCILGWQTPRWHHDFNGTWIGSSKFTLYQNLIATKYKFQIDANFKFMNLIPWWKYQVNEFPRVIKI